MAGCGLESQMIGLGGPISSNIYIYILVCRVGRPWVQTIIYDKWGVFIVRNLQVDLRAILAQASYSTL